MVSFRSRSQFIAYSCLFLTTLAQDDNSCRSYGIDFQDKGAYFQDVNSAEPFTFVSEFEGCQPDMCFNVLVDPNGDSVECSETPMTPDNVPQLSTCPKLKNQLWSGAWSVILMSNNANGDSIAYQRDFDLSVGPQQTITMTPTITVPYTSTVLLNATSTVIDVAENVTLPASTVHIPSTTKIRTKTITPKRVTSTTTKVAATTTVGRPSIQVIKITKIETPTCTVPPRQPTRDPKIRFRPNLTFNLPHVQEMLDILKVAAPAIAFAPISPPRSSPPQNGTTSRGVISSSFRTFRFNGRSFELVDKDAFLRERSDRMKRGQLDIIKRAPDEPVVTINVTDTAAYPTITSTTVITSTATVAVTIETTSTITPPPVTVVSGKEIGPKVAVTAPTPTRVITRYTTITERNSRAVTQTITITSTTTPAADATACKRRGGHFDRF